MPAKPRSRESVMLGNYTRILTFLTCNVGKEEIALRNVLLEASYKLNTAIRMMKEVDADGANEADTAGGGDLHRTRGGEGTG